MIATGGCTALLFDPGLGKSAVVIDYAGLLALKSTTGEARVLVVCPLVAVDTWVIQMEKFVSPQVRYWVEALGGSLVERAEALAARGNQPFRGSPKSKAHPRALHYERSIAWAASQPPGRERPVTASEGPDVVGNPRIVMEVINIDTVMSRLVIDKRQMADLMVDAIKRFAPDLVVVDESHKIKGAQTNASRVLARVSRFVKRRTILTGTVTPAGPLDVFGQWRFLDTYAFGEPQRDGSVKPATWGGFMNRYATTGGWMGKEVIGYKNLDEMQTIMAKNAIVARKADALDLPPTTDVTVPVTLSPAETRAYSEMKSQLATQLANGTLATVPNRLSQMMRLRQITSGHLPDDLGVVQTVGDSKVKTIASLVNDTLVGESRVVVFCFFTHEIDSIARALRRPGTEVMAIGGSTPSEDRLLMRKRFGSDEATRLVMVAQIRTMSLAVNELVTASHAVFGSLSQQRDDYVQGRDRLHRIGQTKPVTFWHVIVPATVDEVILSSHRDKTNLEDALLRHIAAQS
jgi:SNF2 family DNA or RNA helicase